MNYLPTQKYREANLKIKSENDNPHEIVLDVLNELRNNIATLAYCFETDSGVFDIRSKSFSKSLTAIYILQKSLDFDKGGDIDNNLFDLYEFCRKSLLSGLIGEFLVFNFLGLFYRLFLNLRLWSM